MVTTSLIEPRRAGWGLWLQWAGVNIIGLILIGFIGALLSFPLGMVLFGVMSHLAFSGHDTAYFVKWTLLATSPGWVGALVMGILGALQWKVLQTYLPDLQGWIRASIIGGAFGGALAGLSLWQALVLINFDSQMQVVQFMILLLCVVWFIIGVAQWLVIRGHVLQSGWWVLASGISFGVFYPITTGLALIWLLRRSPTALS